MNIPCSVIKDLLPLYMEGIDSAETHQLIEEHLNDCEKCRNELEKLREPDDLIDKVDVIPLKKVKQTLYRKKIFAVLLTIALTLTVSAIFFAYMVSPQYIQYFDGMVGFTEDANGTVQVQINSSIAGYEISSVYSNEMQGQIYYISAWDNSWNKIIEKNINDIFILNPNGEPIACVYYSPNNGSENIPVYGNSSFQTGGSITIPIQGLFILLLVVVGIAFILGIVVYIFRKNWYAFQILLRFEYFPVSYIISQLFVKGLHTETYMFAHDLSAILLLAVPFCFLLWVIGERFIQKKLPWNAL